MKKFMFLIINIYILFLTTNSFCHSGRTDKQGGHYDKKTGIYHYHN